MRAHGNTLCPARGRFICLCGNDLPCLDDAAAPPQAPMSLHHFPNDPHHGYQAGDDELHLVEQERHARRQISHAQSMLPDHQPLPGRYCTCGHDWPCCRRITVTRRLAHHRLTLALTGGTELVPVLTCHQQAATEHRSPRQHRSYCEGGGLMR